MWKKEKLLTMSNFSFSHSVFKKICTAVIKNKGLLGKGLKVMILTKIQFVKSPGAATPKTMNAELQIFGCAHCLTVN